MISHEILQEAAKIIFSELGKAEEKISSLEKKVAELKNNSVKNLPGEIWRDVVGYEGLYQVSNKGRIKSFQWKKVTILQPFKNKIIMYFST